MDFGKLIHDQVPGKNGQTLPPDLTSGAYRIRDLNDDTVANLYEGKVIVDKTFGHAAYGCMICCGPNNPLMEYDPLSLVPGGYANQQVQAVNSCSQKLSTITGDFPTWWTDNTSIATANKNQINGVAVGSTTHNALSINKYWGPREASDGGSCDLSQQQPGGGTDVTPTVTIDSFTPNPIPSGATANAHITVNPSANINLAISSTSTGTATFGASGNTTLTIPETTTVNILGGAESNGSADLTLTASYAGSPLASVPFSVTTGACALVNTGHGGSALLMCPSAVSVYDTYNIGEFCDACQFSCTPIFTAGDASFTPSGCTAVYGGLRGAGNRILTSTQTGNFAPNDCNVHNLQIKTIVRNWDGTVTTSYTGGTFALKCNANGSPACN